MLLFGITVTSNLTLAYFCTILYSMNCDTARASAATGAALFFVSWMPVIYIKQGNLYTEMSVAAKMGWSLLPNMAMSMGCITVDHFELIGLYITLLIMHCDSGKMNRCDIFYFK